MSRHKLAIDIIIQLIKLENYLNGLTLGEKCWIELRETFIKCPPRSMLCFLCNEGEERSRKAKEGKKIKRVLAWNKVATHLAGFFIYNLLMCKSKLLRRKIRQLINSLALIYSDITNVLLHVVPVSICIKEHRKMIETWIYGNLKYVRHMKTLSMTCLWVTITRYQEFCGLFEEISGNKIGYGMEINF